MKNLTQHFMNTVAKNKGFLIFLIFLFSVKWSFADHYRVPTGSMLPTIHIGDHVYTNKIAYDLRFPFTDFILTQTGVPERGDIIVFRYPKEPTSNYVKRLIGIPGDKIDILNGFVKINGQITLKSPENFVENMERLFTSEGTFEYTEKIGENFFTVQRLPRQSRDHQLSFTVPDGQYFFMGDNRDNSADSRVWGFVPRDYLIGKVTGITISFTLDGIIPQINISRFLLGLS